MIMVSSTEWIAGSLTIAPLVIGYLMGIITYKKYLEKRNPLLLLSSILFFAIPSPWLGVSTTFLFQVFNLGTLADTTYVFIYAWSVPIIFTIWIYVTGSLIQERPKLKYYLLIFALILDLIFFWSIYFDKQFVVNSIDGSIFYDSTFTEWANILASVFGAAVLLFVAPTYFWISNQTENELFKFKSRMITAGAVLFPIAAVLDGNLELNQIGQVILVRAMLMFALIFLYFGYNTPRFIQDRYN